MSKWPSCKARRVLAALLRQGWRVKRVAGSHRFLVKPGRESFVFSHHDGEELGPPMMARIARKTGLKPEDL